MADQKLQKGKDFIGVGVGAIIFNDEGKVFLNKRGQNARNERGKWEFPGGGVRFGEKLEDAIKREIKEEFNIEIEILDQLKVSDHIIENEGQHWVSPTFVTKLVAGEPKIMEPDKCDEFKWVDIVEIELDKISIISKGDYASYIEKYGKAPYKAA
jgi:mutator protein MutT